MKIATLMNQKLFDILLLFSREPFARYYMKELEFYSNGNGELLGVIGLDLTDQDYYGCILSRDTSKQYRAMEIEGSILTLEEARIWIDEKMGNNSITLHDNRYEYFDLFQEINNDKQQHPNYSLLKDHIALSSAKEVLKEVSYHYKDIDGNFIDQFQSLNGFDARIWELYLFCFFREQYFSFKRNYNSPDYMIEKFNDDIAVEAVIVSRKSDLEVFEPKSLHEIHEKLKHEVPLLFGGALFDKMKKKYWEKEHVKDKPFVIAIADFHDTMSMTWSFTALTDYLYGYRYDYSFSEGGELVIDPIKIEKHIKPTGSEIPSGFFYQPDSENVSAIIFSSCGTLSKFNRMGKQAGLGDHRPILIRSGVFYDHEPNADKPKLISYTVNEESWETWSEGVVIFHNPNAINPMNPEMFDDRVSQCFFKDNLIHSIMPKYFPYSSYTQNIIPKSTTEDTLK